MQTTRTLKNSSTHPNGTRAVVNRYDMMVRRTYDWQDCYEINIWQNLNSRQEIRYKATETPSDFPSS